MKRFTRALMVGVVGAAAIATSAQAFVEPGGTPAATSSPMIINVGPANQTKAGDLTVMDMKASSGITFGGEKRMSWLPVRAACAWEGWKCDCHSDGSSMAAVSLTFGVRCAAGRVEDAKLFGLAISSKSKTCGASAPSPCAQALYTRENTDSGTFLESAGEGISIAANAVGGFVVDSVKFQIGVVTTIAQAGFDVTKAVVGGAVDSVVDSAKAVGTFASDVWGAGRDFTRTVSALAVDPKANPIQIAVGAGVAAVKAVVAVGASVIKAGVGIVGSVAVGAVKAVTGVVRALCFWC